MEFEPTPKWSVRLFDESMHRFHTPKAPCLPYRLMQRLVLGIVWERLESDENLWPRFVEWFCGLFPADGWCSTRYWRCRDKQ